MELKNKNILIYGMGKSGLSAKSLLLFYKAKVFCFDDKASTELQKKLINSEIFIKNLAFCVISPTVQLSNKYIKKLKKHKVKILTEVELGASLTNSKLISVTGTDGKTTTVTLLNNILNACNKTSVAVGNIGYPITKYVLEDNSKQYAVVELSSFMLQKKLDINQKISIVLNVTSDHLNWHKTLKNYIKCKKNAVKTLNSTDFCILNYDNLITRNMKRITKANCYFVSTCKKVKGCYIENNNIVFNNGTSTTIMLKTTELNILGEHNLYNIMCCLCAGMILKLNRTKMIECVKSFKGLEHRIEFVTKINNVSFYNDSKSTTPNSCLCAINSFNDNIVLIMGGQSKNVSYEDLIKELVKKVKFIVLIGENKYDLEKLLIENNFNNYCVCDNFTKSVKIAFDNCINGVVLLSPASASLDMFSSFEERGEKFKEEVKKLKNEEKK